MGIFNFILGDDSRIDDILFYQSIFKEGDKMRSGFKQIIILSIVYGLLSMVLTGCVPLVVGAMVGAGGYAITSKDTIQGDTDKSYDRLFDAAIRVSKIRGTISQEDSSRGYIELKVESSRVWIRLVRLTRATTRIKISARKYHLSDLELAQEFFTKIIEEAR